MQSIEFESEIKEGNITIPEEYLKYFSGVVKVIIMPVNNNRIKYARKPGPIDPRDFDYPKIDTRGWKFNREEANE